MVYYATLDTSMFRTQAISDYVFFSTRTTTPLQVISVRRRPYIKSVCNTIGPDFQSMSRTTANRAPLVPVQTCVPQTLRILKQLPIPEKPWNSISMDFIEKLPLSSGYTSILVIVDRLSKQSLFIPTHDTIMSPQLAQSSFYMSIPSTVSQATSLLIVVWNSYPISSGPSELRWT